MFQKDLYNGLNKSYVYDTITKLLEDKMSKDYLLLK